MPHKRQQRQLHLLTRVRGVSVELRRGCDPRTGYWTLAEISLMASTTKDWNLLVRLLLRFVAFGFDINTSDADGRTALHLILDELDSRDDQEIVLHALVRIGFDPNAVDNQGRTALQIALP